MSTQTIPPNTRTPVPDSHIELDEQGRPWIVGTNTKVIEVAMDKVAWDLNPDQMHRQHPHLSLAQLHAALSYYYEHKAEMDAELERDRREFEDARRQWRETPQGKKLQELKARRSAP
jgi:uncharacterized protein (DUF433 family)